jgi:hypothetical protein
MVPTKDKMSKSLEEENNNVTPRSLVHLCTIVLNGRHPEVNTGACCCFSIFKYVYELEKQ